MSKPKTIIEIASEIIEIQKKKVYDSNAFYSSQAYYTRQDVFDMLCRIQQQIRDTERSSPIN